ncbi:MAG: hypothetical protein QOD74_717 [Variibacter sp.]|nr:hypothetical protein [Variibacter sp.]
MPKCLNWGKERTERCNRWEDQGHDECQEWRDDGYSQCNAWDKDCCDWWPCSWGCKLISWICTAAVWISNIVCVVAVWIANVVCVGWTIITTAICLAWDAASAAVNIIGGTLESIFGWVLSGIAAIIQIILSIPIIGAFIRWVIGLVTFIIWTIVSLVDLVAGLIGIRPEKRLRVCAVVLADERSRPLLSNINDAVDQLQVAANILKRDANIRLMPSKPFQYATGFGDDPVVTADWITVLDREPGDSDTLDPPCDVDGFVTDLGVAGSKFNLLMMVHCFYGGWRRLLGYGGPISVFFVRSIQGDSGGSGGCGKWIVDFVTISSSAIRTPPPVVQDARRITCHELGHATNLWHIDSGDNPDNLMGTPRPPVADVMDFQMYDWQVLLVRASKHVTYF